MDYFRVKLQMLYVNPCDMKLFSSTRYEESLIWSCSKSLIKHCKPRAQLPHQLKSDRQLWGMGQLFPFTAEHFDIKERRTKTVLTQKSAGIFQYPHSYQLFYCMCQSVVVTREFLEDESPNKGENWGGQMHLYRPGKKMRDLDFLASPFCMLTVLPQLLLHIV